MTRVPERAIERVVVAPRRDTQFVYRKGSRSEFHPASAGQITLARLGDMFDPVQEKRDAYPETENGDVIARMYQALVGIQAGADTLFLGQLC